MTWSEGDLVNVTNLNKKLITRLGWFNPLDYGAVGDGVTDDATALQATLNAIATAGGGVMYVPEGRFLFNTRLDHGADNLNIVGSGWGSILQSGVASGTAFYINDNTSGGSVINGLLLRNFRINGSGTEDALLRADYALDGLMEWVYVRGSGGIGFQAGRGQNFTVSHCNVRQNKGWGIAETVDAQGNAGQTFRVIDSTIKQNGTAGGGTGGIYLLAGAEHLVRGNQIEGHDYDANCRGVMCLTDGTVISENIFESNTVLIEVGSLNGSYGQTVDRTRNNITVTNNTGNNGTPAEIRLVNVNTINWRNNAFKNTTVTVDETGNKYVDLQGLNAAALVTNEGDGKVFSSKDQLSTSTLELQRAFTDGDTTPDIFSMTAFRTANTAPTSITDFNRGHSGKIFFVLVADANTTFVNSSNLATGTGGNITPASGDVLLIGCQANFSSATDRPRYRVLSWFTASTDVAASSGTITMASGSANNGTTTGWHEVAPGRWVPYITDPTP